MDVGASALGHSSRAQLVRCVQGPSPTHSGGVILPGLPYCERGGPGDAADGVEGMRIDEAQNTAPVAGEHCLVGWWQCCCWAWRMSMPWRCKIAWVAALLLAQKQWLSAHGAAALPSHGIILSRVHRRCTASWPGGGA